MRAVLLIFLIAFSFSCVKKDLSEYFDTRPNFEPPIAIEDLDLHQFDAEEKQTEVLSDEEQDLVYESLLDTARLFYVNTGVKKATQDLKKAQQGVLLKTAEEKPKNVHFSFEEEEAAKLLLQTSLKPELCNPQLSDSTKLTSVLTEGQSCPFLINSQITYSIAFGKNNVDHFDKKGRLNIQLRPELITDFSHKNVVAIELNSTEKSISQFYTPEKKAYRDFRNQSAQGSVQLADGQVLPYEHQFQVVFSYDQEASSEFKFRLVAVRKVKTRINGKTVVLTVKSQDGKEFEDSQSFYRCSINNKLVTGKNCLILSSQFEHY